MKHNAESPPPVAVFDADLPPALAFIRSLGRRGVPVVAYSNLRHAPGRYSRFATEFRTCPDVRRPDEFIPWLVEELAAKEITTVAPTSDFVVFSLAEASDRSGVAIDGLPEPDRVRTCLFKDRFAVAVAEAGFPAPPSATPLTIEEAVDAAEQIGYPLILKPRSHIGVGVDRGAIVGTVRGLREAFVPYELDEHQRAAVSHDGGLAYPMLQKYVSRNRSSVVSVTGFVGSDGVIAAVGHSRQLRQWPPRTGVGTLFEALPSQPFTKRALEAVRQVIGRGVFELEVLIDDKSGECWPIDLNPRAYGQIALDMARGNDLPGRWYREVSGTSLALTEAPRQPARYWTSGVPLLVDGLVRLVRGPARLGGARRMAQVLRAPGVGGMFDRRDPLPGLAFGALVARHPGGLIKPYLRDRPPV